MYTVTFDLLGLVNQVTIKYQEIIIDEKYKLIKFKGEFKNNDADKKKALAQKLCNISDNENTKITILIKNENFGKDTILTGASLFAPKTIVNDTDERGVSLQKNTWAFETVTYNN